uniref:ATP synthase protein 8 n=1 Tax=Pagurus lanuginosus TaxID=1929470 RepID=A0A2Z5UY29_9EUCA|nr:ATP synthase protein 8 [Pagurus lanuginosus]
MHNYLKNKFLMYKFYLMNPMSYFLIPQMAPLMWLNLLFMFLFIFLLFFISNYYMISPKK